MGQQPRERTAVFLERAAELFEIEHTELMARIIREGGRTIYDAQNEVREAIDFCRYYAAQARHHFEHPILLPGITGERNELQLVGRGVFICISPWNFSVAEFFDLINARGKIAALLAPLW